jgi:hypothetical protein
MSVRAANQPALELALREIEAHVSDGGWDQPTRLFALVLTDQLLASEPALATEVASEEEAPLLTSV